MCGRTACNLCPDEYQKACSYFDETCSKYIQPTWKNLCNSGFTFKPSVNICPGDVTPVLVSSNEFSEIIPDTDRCLAPMLWGLIPRWHKGEPKKHGLTTNNCRIEGINGSKGRSKLYSTPLKEGKRCVVICEGYYEWQTTTNTKTKQPYYIYATQEKNLKVEDSSCWKNTKWNDINGWQGPKLLKFAAIYDTWSYDSDNKVYSYSIITLESNQTLAWLHHRMPAILDDENVIQEWLDMRVSSSRAVTLLSSSNAKLSWHPVSRDVNNATNKNENCNKPIKLKTATSNALQNWLKTGSIKKRNSDCSSSENISDLKKLRE